MAVTSVVPLYSTNPRSSRDGNREFVSVYQVITNDSNDGPITARDAPGIPVVNEPYTFGNDFDFGCFAADYSVKLKAAPEDHKRLWEVSVTFTTLPIRRGEDQYLDDPLDEPAIITGSFVSDRCPVTSDKDGNPVDNSAGDQFEGLERDNSHPTLTITQNFETWDLTQHIAYIDSVNSTTFFGQTARKWKLSNIRTTQNYRGSDDTPYYQSTFEFLANPDTWDFMPADRGWFYLDASNNRQLFRDEKGLPLNSQGNLDGSGGQLASTANIVYFDGAGGNPAAFRVYTEKDFGDLGIPTSDPTIT